jgi:DoxX-like protein
VTIRPHVRFLVVGPTLGGMALGPRRLISGLVVVQIADGVFNAVPTQWLKDDLDRLGFPWRFRVVLPVLKGASAVGLLGGLRWPRLGRVTAGALVAYFTAAIAFHVRAKDSPRRMSAAVGMLGWSLLSVRAFDVVADGSLAAH